MAENETLDLGSSGTKRWDPVVRAVRANEPAEKVAAKCRQALFGGVRKSLKDFSDSGMSLADLISASASQTRLRELVRRHGSHQYALLFEQVVRANPTADDAGILRGFVDTIFDTHTDQIKLRVAEADDARTFLELDELFGAVREKISLDIERVVTELVKNPNYVPRLKPGQAKAAAPAGPTQELLRMSLAGSSEP